MTTIKTIDQNGNIKEVATYLLDSKKSLIAYYMQTFKKNFNTFGYPSNLDIIKETKSKRGHYMTVNGIDYLAY